MRKTIHRPAGKRGFSDEPEMNIDEAMGWLPMELVIFIDILMAHKHNMIYNFVQ